ncbi:hypothetical protein LWI29_022443 [Acer saccharum]|uniref:Uncharacterized protein n=1 Tax=Acer saccharum TaxID=4024 RepID=A0AA39SLL8_ACESA|nr:hypothetical protein LWI29_022443 [Acer saccharum]
MATTITAPRIQAPWLLLIFLTTFAATSPLKTIPRLAVHHRINLENPSTSNLNPYNPADHKTYYYDQTLDHFNYQPQSYATFRQRYDVNEKNWGGSRVAAPIFAYLGEESDLEGDVEAIGFLRDNAARFNALQVYIEGIGKHIKQYSSIGDAARLTLLRLNACKPKRSGLVGSTAKRRS